MKHNKPEKEKLVMILCVDVDVKVRTPSRLASCFGCNKDIWASEATIEDAMEQHLAPGGELRFVCGRCALNYFENTVEELKIGKTGPHTLKALNNVIKKDRVFPNKQNNRRGFRDSKDVN